jgi:hypothetical protein
MGGYLLDCNIQLGKREEKLNHLLGQQILLDIVLRTKSGKITTYILTLSHKTDDAFGGRGVCRIAQARRNDFP